MKFHSYEVDIVVKWILRSYLVYVLYDPFFLWEI